MVSILTCFVCTSHVLMYMFLLKGDVSSNSSPEGSPRHERTHNNPSGGTGASGDDGGSSGDSSSYSSPPSSPRLNRSSSLSSIDDILAKDFPQEDLPSLILKGLGKS